MDRFWNGLCLPLITQFLPKSYISSFLSGFSRLSLLLRICCTSSPYFWSQNKVREHKEIIFISCTLPLKMILVKVTFMLKKGDISRHKFFGMVGDSIYIPFVWMSIL